MNKLISALRVFVILALIFGLGYPLTVALLSHYLFPHQAQGSLMIRQGEVIGSRLIAQEFTLPQYFHSRPSSVDYQADNSGASSFSSLSQKWLDGVLEKSQKYRRENNLSSVEPIPSDAVTFSASGLDPHISRENAFLQANRVAAARTMNLDKVKKLIHRCTDRDFIGIWGHSGVNVLVLNLALDAEK